MGYYSIVTSFTRVETREHPDTKQRIANLTSNILNPFLICLAVILMFSFSSTKTTSEAIKWALLSMGLSIVPIFLVIVYLVHTGGLDEILTNARKQRTKIYVASGVSAIAGYFTLSYLKAPHLLVAGFTAVISVAVIFMLINLWWKISVHTGCIAASSVVMVMIYGWAAAAIIPLVPLTAWSRIKLEHHSIAQAITGAVLASLIVAVIFYPIARG
jgi:putative transposase